MHVLTVKVKAGGAGDLSRTLTIVTDLPGDNTAELPIKAIGGDAEGGVGCFERADMIQAHQSSEVVILAGGLVGPFRGCHAVGSGDGSASRHCGLAAGSRNSNGQGRLRPLTRRAALLVVLVLAAIPSQNAMAGT